MFTMFDMHKQMTEAQDQRTILIGGWLQTLQAMTVAFYTMAALSVALTLATLINIITVIF
jgi:hypothetical protein